MSSVIFLWCFCSLLMKGNYSCDVFLSVLASSCQVNTIKDYLYNLPVEPNLQFCKTAQSCVNFAFQIVEIMDLKEQSTWYRAEDKRCFWIKKDGSYSFRTLWSQIHLYPYVCAFLNLVFKIKPLIGDFSFF